jgi:hypothetical protein
MREYHYAVCISELQSESLAQKRSWRSEAYRPTQTGCIRLPILRQDTCAFFVKGQTGA